MVTSGGQQAQSLCNFFVSISFVVALWGWVILWLISNWIKLLLNHKSMMFVSLKLFLWKRRSWDSESKILRNELVFRCDLWTSYKCKTLAHPASLPLLRLWRPVLNTLNLFKTYTILFQYLSIKLYIHLKNVGGSLYLRNVLKFLFLLMCNFEVSDCGGGNQNWTTHVRAVVLACFIENFQWSSSIVFMVNAVSFVF